MEKRQLEEILERYRRDECTEEERAIIEKWYANWEVQPFDLSAEELSEDLAEVKSILPQAPKTGKLFVRIAAASAIVLVIGASFYLINAGQNIPTATLAHSTPITPGKNQATLTLSDGSVVPLGSNQLAAIKQPGVQLVKDEEGKLIYVDSASGKTINAFNSITTPNGGSYDVVLSDGTRVKLNAASKITFPTVFGTGHRTVDIEGEAYFEVAKNAKKPFIVNSGKQTVQVLGTHFNIKSYKDESQIKTTLLEGSILVKGKTAVLLQPGEQAIAGQDVEQFKVLHVDVETAVAWKNDLFFFENEPLTNCMREVARWYNVDVVYQDEIPNKRVWGSVNKFSDISKVLDILELTGNVHFKIEGRRLIVMK